MQRFSSNNPIVSVSVDTTLKTIRAKNTGSPTGKSCVTIPVHNLAGYLYLYPSSSGKGPDGVTALTVSDIPNYGTRYEASDKVATVIVEDGLTLYGTMSAGTFSAYPTEWL